MLSPHLDGSKHQSHNNSVSCLYNRWIYEIRTKLFLMEYMILLITFVAIQIIGMDFGILFGVVVALIDHVASTTR